MSHLRDPASLAEQEIEDAEKQSLRCLFQAEVDFGYDAAEIFSQSVDEVKDVAEDLTREMLDRFGGYQIAQRIFGNVDYRKARYMVFPDVSIRQALFVDSKAEKACRTATLQMSQLSMSVRQRRGGTVVEQPGKLPPISVYQGLNYLTTTLLVHYHYEDDPDGRHILRDATLAAVPNGKLQSRYNPNADDTIWLVGRNAPTLGEDFRVRLAFAKLEGKAPWRVQRIVYNQGARRIDYGWQG